VAGTRTPRTRIATIRTRTPTTQTHSALERCVSPVEAERFLGEYWERRPLLVPRDEEGRFDDLLSAAELEQLVTSGGLRHPAFRLVKAGEKIALGDYTEDIRWRPQPFTGTAKVERIAAEFSRGATIVLQALHVNHPPLARFCRGLERELGYPVQANAYYTPRSAQGLPVHHDTHDVLCLQLSGEKRWLVYPPALELPLRDQKYGPELGEPGKPVMDVTLRAGDTLYLPRGWLHKALTSDMDSLHLTIGINVYTWLEAFKAALEEAAAEEVDLRRGVDGTAPDGIVDQVAVRLQPDAVARRMREKFVGSRRPVRDDLFDQLRALDSLDLETPLMRRETVLADLVASGDEVRLVYEGREVTFPAKISSELGFIAASEEPFRLADLPGTLDEESRLVLARRLVREGFLRIKLV
jgi:ribosomal protein L16 Arg81 hydroxylase